MPAVSAIILAGGRSRRLGIDKRSLFLTSARSQLSETIERMTHVADDIVVAGDPADDVANRATVVADAQAGIGPIAGLLTGLCSVRHERAVVVACDLPFLSLELLRGLLAVPRDYALLVPRRDDGTLEMLHAVYSTSIVAILREYIRSGERRLSGLLSALESSGQLVRVVDDDWARRYDPALRSYFNLNTPADLQWARNELRGDRGDPSA